MMDAMKGTELREVALGPPSRSAEAPTRLEPSCQEDAAEERQTEDIFECQSKIRQSKGADQSLTERVEVWRRFRRA